MKQSSRVWIVTFTLLVCSIVKSLQAADYPAPKEGSWIVRDFRFHTGETLPELRLHYTTVGSASGEAVLLLHGTDGSATNLLNPALPVSFSVQDSRSTQRATSSSCRTRSARENHPNHPINCEQSFRAIIMMTWCAPSTDWLQSTWA